ncbi:hypothetical protein PV08_04359 [Exophiala spinifera]|uniref:Uncharacterized protein n=1 Tax=Exophiala spinifera TaxID=91928 RepID=A0A0D2BDX8_9EURO|nr:uncharacterized protein PV08_04359 [Exophiala spinifera]KIW17168.1 hypothetical protein PV08_04359 [Exophiala spinifera]
MHLLTTLWSLQKLQNARSPGSYPSLSSLKPFARLRLATLRTLEPSILSVRCLHTEALQSSPPPSDDGIHWNPLDHPKTGLRNETPEAWTEQEESLPFEQQQQQPDGAENNGLTKAALGQTYTVQESRLFNLKLPPVNLQSSIETLKLARGLGLPEDELVLDPYDRAPPEGQPRSGKGRRRELAPAIRMRLAFLQKTSLPHMKEMAARRAKLPIAAHDQIVGEKSLINTINCSDVTVVLAKTGSGKTTQVPQIILENAILRNQGPDTTILCAEPRRIAATSTARRIAYERDEALGQSVGYQIRNELKLPNERGSITLCTTGILLHRLLTRGWPFLQRYSHIILDEVHERDAQLDLVLSLIRRHIQTLKECGLDYPKIILMSATIDPSSFLNYFVRSSEPGTLTACSFEVGGSGHPVNTLYLPEILNELAVGKDLHPTMQALLQGKTAKSSADYIKNELIYGALHQGTGQEANSEDANVGETCSVTAFDASTTSSVSTPSSHYLGLVTAVIAHLASTKPEGDVLVFLPGKLDIDTIYDLLRDMKPMGIDFEDERRFRIFKLHSAFRDTNDNVFTRVPIGCRRIVLATNIAETSITLPEVVYVVDAGKMRNSIYDPLTFKRSLPYEWISKTSMIQRRGRAGRVSPGNYYALFTEERCRTFRPMARPKITVSNLADVVLLLAAHPNHGDAGDSSSPREFLRGMIDPPSEDAIDSAYRDLQSLSALDSDGNITRVGAFLADMNVHAASAKGVLLGTVFGCLEPMVILACHDFNNPLIHNAELSIGQVRESKRHFDRDSESDLSILIDAFRQYHAASQAGDELLMSQLSEERCIKHSAYAEMMLTSQAVHQTLAKYGMVDPPAEGQTIFEAIPKFLNYNSDNMVLVKALAVNTVTAELAAWDATVKKWTLDIQNNGYPSRASILHEKTRSVRRTRRKYRTDGRLIAYAWKSSNDDVSDGAVWLENNSMVTPLMLTLFSRSARLESPQTIKFNDWLRIETRVDGVDDVFAAQSARIVMEARKMLDRFLNWTWTRILPNDEAGFEAAAKNVKAHFDSSATTCTIVKAITEMLRSDNDFWQAYRAERRADIEAEEAARAEQALMLAEERAEDMESVSNRFLLAPYVGEDVELRAEERKEEEEEEEEDDQEDEDDGRGGDDSDMSR